MHKLQTPLRPLLEDTVMRVLKWGGALKTEMNGHQAFTRIAKAWEKSDRMRNKLAKQNCHYESFKVFFGRLAPRTPSTQMTESKNMCVLVDKGWLGLLASWGKHCLLHAPSSHPFLYLNSLAQLQTRTTGSACLERYWPPVWISTVDARAPMEMASRWPRLYFCFGFWLLSIVRWITA